MRKKFLFHKTLSIILIVLFITFFTFSSVQAYSSYKYNDYMNIIFQDEQYFDRNTYKNFLNVFNSYTKGLNFNSDYNTIKKQMITKGAVEEILNICTMIDYKGKVSPITKDVKDNIRKMTKKLNEEGLRVIAVCQKNDINEIDNFSVADEKNMVLMGFIGFLDPPKESAKASIEALKEAGIRTIILTGANV